MAIPRAWLRDGAAPAIERAATHFGPMSLRYESRLAHGSIQVVLDPPIRRAPQKMFLRVRHPEQKPMTRVTIDGELWTNFDAKREWIELPKLRQRAVIDVRY